MATWAGSNTLRISGVPGNLDTPTGVRIAKQRRPSAPNSFQIMSMSYMISLRIKRGGDT